MAKSKNKRKNGKAVSRIDVNTKRMRRMAQADLKHLIVCSGVDIAEGEGDGKPVSVPRGVVFNRKTCSIVEPTRLQALALSSQRWRWNIHTAIVCRKQDGEVYLWRDDNIFTETEVLLSEMNDYVTDTLCDRWEECNPLHRLTMVWIAAPYDMGDVPLEALLAPLHHFNILAHSSTQYEREHPDHVVMVYHAATLQAYAEWWTSQGRFKRELRLQRKVELHFLATGEKMKAGELIAFRERLQDFGNLGEGFAPRATVQGFVGLGVMQFDFDGVAHSCLMSALQDIPACLTGKVYVQFEDGRYQYLTFRHGEEVASW